MVVVVEAFGDDLELIDEVLAEVAKFLIPADGILNDFADGRAGGLGGLFAKGLVS